jgi:hypothetical protein
MKLGDCVITKKTGLPASGEVCGMLVAPMYVAQIQQYKESFGRWNTLYPDWYEKPIVYVVFDEPMRAMTFEEFVIGIPEEHKSLDSKTLYEIKIPESKVIAYPIDDLEVLE